MKTILLVDDEFALSDTLKDFLEGEGYAVETAGNGKEGLERMVAHRPDLIVSDLMMPIMDGKTMLRAMRDDPALRSLPVILSSSARRQVAIPASEGLPEFSEFLRKPLDLDVFLELIVKLIGPPDEGRGR